MGNWMERHLLENFEWFKKRTRTVNQEKEYYNPYAIISVGYHVNSIWATQFRW